MDTVETREQVTPGAGSLYDGFISYSHAADDLLAPRLQAGLQRFAKPWWRRRALRVFRDESSLSANPHLWSSITDALDGSDWFVLLLSPEAAASDWVNQEVEYWVEHKDPERIIPVLTDGSFAWADGEVTGDAMPPALHHVFSDEPRWVDLRFARAEEQLDLQDPRFADAVADIASAIRQVPKDELASEEVRQHRRTVRTAWGAGAVVLLLALAASGAALFALDQRNDARRQAAIAMGGELTAEARNALASDPELSIHLTLRALRLLRDTGADTVQAVSVLREGLAADRVKYRIPGGHFVAVHPDGRTLATADTDTPGGIALWDFANHQVVDQLEGSDGDGSLPEEAAFSPDGNGLAVAFSGSAPAVRVMDLETGGSFDIDIGEDSDWPTLVSEFGLHFSPDGELLAFEVIRGGDFDSLEDSSVEVWSVPDRQLVRRFVGAAGPSFSSDGLLLYTAPSDREGEADIVAADPMTGEEVRPRIETDFGIGWVAGSPDLRWIVLSENEKAVVFDAATGAEVARPIVDRANRPEWLDNDRFFLGGESALRVIDAATGDVLVSPPGQGVTYDAIPGADLVALEALDAVLVLDTSPVGGFEVGGWEAPVGSIWRAGFGKDGERVVVSANPTGWGDVDTMFSIANAVDGTNPQIVEGGSAAWFPDMNPSGRFIPAPDVDGSWAIHDIDTGGEIYRAPDGWSIHGVSDDGSEAVINEDEGVDECGPTRLVSTESESVIAEILGSGCVARAIFSPDGRLVFMAIDGFGSWRLFDTDSGAIVAGLDSSGGEPCASFSAAFTPDGATLLAGFQPVCALDVSKLKAGAAVDEAVRREIQGHETGLLRIAVSPDGSMVATSSFSEPLRVWDLSDGRLLGEFGGSVAAGTHDGDFHPTEPWLLVTTPPNVVRIHTLDVDELIEIAEASLSRDLTDDECDRYFRGPCPGV